MINIEKTNKNYIYKYFTINEFLLRTLINNELYFSNPNDFNDPFDCQFKLEFVKNSLAEKQFHENLTRSGTSIEEVKSLNLENTTYESFESNLISEIRARLGVACFSENPDEILMWSHYANSHKGICLKFDWKIHQEYFKGDKVYYDNLLPTIKYSSNQQLLDEITKVIMVKLKMWSYEDEIRSVINVENDGKRNPSFNPTSLVGVIFGEKVSKENIQLIERIISLHDSYNGVNFYNASLNRKKSKIIITPYNSCSNSRRGFVV